MAWRRMVVGRAVDAITGFDCVIQERTGEE